jgi:diaminopimelate epimerase
MRFTKMQGLGNDFVVLDGISRPCELSAADVRWLADRRYGVGCDQVLVAQPPTRPDADCRYRIYNADGGEVEHCGNGVRCLARFLQREGLAGTGEICFETVNGLSRVRVNEDASVTVDMGRPVLDPNAIPFHAAARAPTYQLTVDDVTYTIGAVSMGNPHAVLSVADIDSAAIATLGPAIESHPSFPNRANVGFMAVDSPDRVRLRVYERGAGETLACGTGACAAVVAGRLQGQLADSVRVTLPGGELMIYWPGDEAPVEMTGPAAAVFTGETLPPN